MQVIIFGGAGLIGAEFSRVLASQGNLVLIADINHQAAMDLASSISSSGAKAFGFQVDITSSSSVRKLIDEIQVCHGKVDAIVNCSYPRGNNYGVKFERVQYNDFCDSLSKHLGGFFLVSQIFAEEFKRQGGGCIVNVASIYGFLVPRFKIYEGLEMTVPIEYSLIKAGVIQLTKYIAQYYKGSRVRCNALLPGGVLDGQPEIFLRRYEEFCSGKGMLFPSDLNGSLLYLLSDASKFVNGQSLVVDDGFSL